MTEITLQLKHSPAPIRQAVAWFIAGADVTLWIEEICRWKLSPDRSADIPARNNARRLSRVGESGTEGSTEPAADRNVRAPVSHDHLRLLVLPRALDDRTAAGVLVIVPTGTRPACVPRALGFGVIAEKLYLPVDAQLWPPVEPHELKLLHEVQAFHPGIGLVGFDQADCLKLADLLRQPPSRLENWNCAAPGIETNHRLYSIQLLAPISIQEIFGDAPNEIGSDPIVDLPRAPDEPSSHPVSQWLTEANRRLAQGIRAFLQRLPHSGASRTWINELED